MPDAFDVFLSYARADDAGADSAAYDDPARSFMRRLYNALTADGLRVWWDKVNLPARGESFTKEIETTIRSCARLVLVCGPGAAISNNVRAEVEVAQTYCKPITLILAAGDYHNIPEALRDINAIDFREPRNFDAALADLLDRLSDPAQVATLFGVDALPSFYLKRAAFDTARKALLIDGVHAAAAVISAPKSATAVYGYGGIGKSTLAAALAHDCDVRRMYKDGVIWVTVGQTPAYAALQARIGVTVFGDNAEHYKDEASGKLALSGVFKDRMALIVLDDVWDHQVVDYFPINGTACRMLITTRSGELARQIDGLDIALELLSPAEGAALLAGVSGGSADTPIFVRIADALGGHTLAIRLAGLRLKKKGLAYAEKILNGLNDPADPFGHLLVNANDKNLNLSKSLAQSLELLDDDLKRRFRALGVLALDAAFDLAALAAVWGDADAAAADRPLESLLDAGLIEEAGDGRYSLHRLLRAYARALLIAAGEVDEVSERHFAHFAGLHGPSADHTNVDYLQTITADFDNLQAALAWGLAQQPEAACDLIAALGNYLGVYQPSSVRKPLLSAGLAAAEQIGYAAGQASTLRSLGDLAMREDDYGDARRRYAAALALFEGIPDRLGQANTLQALGDLARLEADYGDARRRYAAALALFEGIPARLGQANTLKALGDLSVLEDTLPAARDYFDQAMRLYTAIPDAVGQMNTLISLARMARDKEGDRAAAQRHFEALFAIIDRIPAYRDHPVSQSLRREYAALADDTPATSDPQAQVMALLRGLYAQGGEAAVREALKDANMTEEVLSALLADLASAPPQPPQVNTLPAETVQAFAGNTVAVLTGVPDKRDEWRAALTQQRAGWAAQGEEYRIEFADALLALIDGGTPAIPPGNPYADVVRQVVEAVAGYDGGA